MRLILPMLSAMLASLAACGSDSSNPDASAGDDTTGDDTTGDDDPDATPPLPDAAAGCAADQLCFTYNAIDGVTDLPAGRLVIAYVEDDGEGDSAEIAYDGVWTTATTAVDLADIALPGAGFTSAFPDCGDTAELGVAVAVIVVDADGNGSIELGELDSNIYGWFQEIIAYLNVECPPIEPDVPDGLAMGVHVYTNATPVVWLDGVPSEMQTCDPGSKACASLETPL